MPSFITTQKHRHFSLFPSTTGRRCPAQHSQSTPNTTTLLKKEEKKKNQQNSNNPNQQPSYDLPAAQTDHNKNTADRIKGGPKIKPQTLCLMISHIKPPSHYLFMTTLFSYGNHKYFKRTLQNAVHVGVVLTDSMVTSSPVKYYSFKWSRIL